MTLMNTQQMNRATRIIQLLLFSDVKLSLLSL